MKDGHVAEGGPDESRRRRQGPGRQGASSTLRSLSLAVMRPAVADLDAQRNRAGGRFRIDVGTEHVVAAAGVGDDLAAAAGRAGDGRESPSPQAILAVSLARLSPAGYRRSAEG